MEIILLDIVGRYLFTPIHSLLISNSNYENCHKTFPTIPVPFLFCNKNIE